MTAIICSKPLGSATSVTGYIQLPEGIRSGRRADHELQELVRQLVLFGAL